MSSPITKAESRSTTPPSGPLSAVVCNLVVTISAIAAIEARATVGITEVVVPAIGIAILVSTILPTISSKGGAVVIVSPVVSSVVSPVVSPVVSSVVSSIVSSVVSSIVSSTVSSIVSSFSIPSATLANSKLRAIILRPTLCNRHENWLMVRSTGHGAHPITPWWQPIRSST